MSVVESLIFTLAWLISVQSIRAIDLPILHPECNEYDDTYEPTHLPYPNDCTKFYKCSGGYAFTLNCPNGLHWSVNLNRCEYPAQAGCKTNSNNDGNLPRTTTRSTPVNGANSEIIVVNCPVGENPNEPTHLPYPGDCSKFFKCKIGKAYPLSCPLGLHWSVALNRCDWPAIAKCVMVNMIPPSTKSTVLTTVPTPALNHPVQSSTTTTAQAPASSAAATSSRTPAPTTVTWQTVALTPSSTSAPIPVSTTIPNPNLSTTEVNALCNNNSSAFVKYPGNCMRYIKCVNGIGTTYSCPGSLLFNSRIGVCTRTCG